MGVTLQNGTVHERAGVTLVGVTANVLLNLSAVTGSELPLQTGGESCAAASAETGIQNGLNNLVGSHLGQNLTQSSVAVQSDVLFNVLGVDYTAVTERNAELRSVESGIVQRCMSSISINSLITGIVVNQSFNNTTLEQMLGNDLLNILCGYVAVKGSVGVYDNDGTESAKTEATGLNDLDFLSQSVLFNSSLKRCLNLGASGRSTSRTATTQYMSTNHL